MIGPATLLKSGAKAMKDDIPRTDPNFIKKYIKMLKKLGARDNEIAILVGELSEKERKN